MFVKICGIRDVETARTVAQLLPDAIGLNFYAASSRVTTPEIAAEIVRELPAEVEPVGVFVNHSREQIESIADRCRLTTLQLHGDESPELARTLIAGGFDVIRAVRIDHENVGELAQIVEPWLALRLRAILVDARVAGCFGGTGTIAPWEPLAAAWRCDWPALLLAGGLTPDNIADAVRMVGPWGVDTAGGVESAPGIKDPGKSRAFIERARAAGSTDR